jgi:hypothetical protein
LPARLALLAATLLAAGPAFAQAPADRALQNLSQLRGIVAVQAAGAARTRCGIAPGMEAELFNQMRVQPEAAGLQVAPAGRTGPGGPNQVIVAGGGAPGLPSLLFSFSVVTLTGEGVEAACATALTGQLRARVAGRMAATGTALDQEVIVWATDATDIVRPAALASAMRSQLLAAVERLVADWRAQQPRPAAAPPTKAMR